MRALDELFDALARSDFRRRFRLDEQDARYLEQRGLADVMDHARRFIAERLAPAAPRNDGKQTPMRGHPVFVAQHATATCCRSCLAKWHQIEQGRPLTAAESEHVLSVLRRWLTTAAGGSSAAPATTDSGRAILHVDMDAFYASVEVRDDPTLAGKPVIVGGTPEGRGVVAAASYAVRKFGVHSAMPTATALRLCPQAVVLPVRMKHYAQVSRQIHEVFHRYTPLVEPLSLDEAFLDVTGSRELFGPAAEIARRLKAEILAETGLVASVGVAPNKFLAKIASDLEKPDALVVVDPDGVQAFLDPLPVGRLWGVGRATHASMDRLRVRTIGDLRRISMPVLRDAFGRQGEHFWRLSRGRDERPVVPDRQAKSISHETTFAQDIRDQDALRGWLLELTEQVGVRLRRHQRQGRTVHLKVRFADFRTITRSRTLKNPTDVTQEIWGAADELLATVEGTRSGVRLLGVGVSGFGSGRVVQRTLFDEEEGRDKQRQVDKVADAVREKFGASALSRGAGLLRPRRPDGFGDGSQK